jgi:hypothetical protein
MLVSVMSITSVTEPVVLSSAGVVSSAAFDVAQAVKTPVTSSLSPASSPASVSTVADTVQSIAREAAQAAGKVKPSGNGVGISTFPSTPAPASGWQNLLNTLAKAKNALYLLPLLIGGSSPDISNGRRLLGLALNTTDFASLDESQRQSASHVLEGHVRDGYAALSLPQQARLEAMADAMFSKLEAGDIREADLPAIARGLYATLLGAQPHQTAPTIATTQPTTEATPPKAVSEEQHKALEEIVKTFTPSRDSIYGDELEAAVSEAMTNPLVKRYGLSRDMVKSALVAKANSLTGTTPTPQIDGGSQGVQASGGRSGDSYRGVSKQTIQAVAKDIEEKVETSRTGEEITIGRLSANSVQLPLQDSTMSREHASVTKQEDGTYILKNLSRNVDIAYEKKAEGLAALWGGKEWVTLPKGETSPPLSAGTNIRLRNTDDASVNYEVTLPPVDQTTHHFSEAMQAENSDDFYEWLQNINPEDVNDTEKMQLFEKAQSFSEYPHDINEIAPDMLAFYGWATGIDGQLPADLFFTYYGNPMRQRIDMGPFSFNRSDKSARYQRLHNELQDKPDVIKNSPFWQAINSTLRKQYDIVYTPPLPESGLVEIHEPQRINNIKRGLDHNLTLDDSSSSIPPYLQSLVDIRTDFIHNAKNSEDKKVMQTNFLNELEILANDIIHNKVPSLSKNDQTIIENLARDIDLYVKPEELQVRLQTIILDNGKPSIKFRKKEKVEHDPIKGLYIFNTDNHSGSLPVVTYPERWRR